jgi:DNA-dependent RNA polymerase auxiliary subunit epsilon
MANYNLGSFKHRYYEQKYRTKLFESRLNVEFLDDFSDEHLEKCL